MARGPKPVPMEIRLFRRRHIDEAGCWNWTGRQNGCGYGSISIRQPDGPPRAINTHRIAYEHFVGPIPAGLYIDHLCRNRACFNPEHLEPVTARENLMRSPIAPAGMNSRKTHCPQGHEYTPDNIYVNRGTGRTCKACNRERSRNRSKAVSA